MKKSCSMHVEIIRLIEGPRREIMDEIREASEEQSWKMQA